MHFAVINTPNSVEIIGSNLYFLGQCGNPQKQIGKNFQIFFSKTVDVCIYNVQGTSSKCSPEFGRFGK